MDTRKKLDSSGLFDTSGRLISTLPTPAQEDAPRAVPVLPQSVEIANPSSPQSGGAVPPKNPGDTAAHREPPPQISNAEFVKAIFRTLPAGVSAVVCSKPGDPTSGGWHAMKVGQVDQQCLPNWNNYFNCSIFHEESPGTIHARKDSFFGLHVILLDDMGTKVQWAQLGDFKPSFVVETSPKNFQAGIILEKPLDDIEMANRLLNAIIAKGLSDPGATGVARWARLPVGINGKPKYKSESGAAFQCRLARWNPERRYTAEEIVVGLNLELTPQLSSAGDASKTTITLPARKISPALVARLPQLLDAIDPDCVRDDWVHVLMGVFHTTGGSDEGFALVDAWSSKGKKYCGTRNIEIQWKSFRLDIAKPRTIGTLIKMAREAGADVDGLMQGCERFEDCDTVVVDAEVNAACADKGINPLTKFSLLGHTGKLEAQMVEEKRILGDMALQGQSTVLFGPPNMGKTAITLDLTCKAISAGFADPKMLYYINMDDNSSGLVAKNKLADEYGFHMLADGHQGFELAHFTAAMEEMIANDTAKGVVIILDTLKKFVNPMAKDECRRFTKMARRFSMKGGTVIALAHVNKHRNLSGKVVYAGTSDIVDDFDCAYTLDVVSESTDTNTKVVEFTNFKRRGSVTSSAAYSYSVERGISYEDLILSIQEVDSEQLKPLKQASDALSDAAMIASIEGCISSGIVTKMKLASAAADHVKVSHRLALKVIEKYTGEDATLHRWRYVVRARGAHVFELLERPEASKSEMVGGVAACASPDDSNAPAGRGSGNATPAMGQAHNFGGNTLEDALKESHRDGGIPQPGVDPLDIF